MFGLHKGGRVDIRKFPMENGPGIGGGGAKFGETNIGARVWLEREEWCSASMCLVRCKAPESRG
jgi:hypothetical protein